MDSKKKQEYTLRITQANRSELVIIVYELFLEYTHEAYTYHLDNKMVEFEESVQRTQKFVLELMETLDFGYSVSKDLYALYIYINKLLIRAIMKHEVKPLEEAESLMETLLVGFRKVNEADTSGAVMVNTQSLYAGLTYGRDNLTEICNDKNIQNRGFMA